MPSAPSVLLFGTYDSRLHPRVAVLRDGLAANGCEVTELNAPLGLSTADKVAAARSVRSAFAFLWATATSWLRLALRRRGFGRPDAIVVGYMGHLDVHLASLLFPRSLIVLDHLVGLSDTLRDRDLGGTSLRRILELVDRAAMARADVVVVDTAFHEGALPDGARGRAVVVPVGATAEWSPSKPDDHNPEEALHVAFFGLFTPLQGTPTIGEAIALLSDRADIQFTMIGSGQDLDAARAASADSPNAKWIPWVDAADLPPLVAAHDVCLGIFGTGAKASRVVPTKVYQGLAAGCAVVTGDSPAARTDLAEAAVLVEPGNAAALATALRDLRDAPDTLASARAAARVVGRRFTPDLATRQLTGRMMHALGRGSQ